VPLLVIQSMEDNYIKRTQFPKLRHSLHSSTSSIPTDLPAHEDDLSKGYLVLACLWCGIISCTKCEPDIARAVFRSRPRYKSKCSGRHFRCNSRLWPQWIGSSWCQMQVLILTTVRSEGFLNTGVNGNGWIAPFLSRDTLIKIDRPTFMEMWALHASNTTGLFSRVVTAMA
jgi:hypothetical protein